MNYYTSKLKHDKGCIFIKTTASSDKQAFIKIADDEGCPMNAIQLKEVDNKSYNKRSARTLFYDKAFNLVVPMFKVFKVSSKSDRKTIIERNLTEAEAQRLVKSYPDSNKTMICYARQ